MINWKDYADLVKSILTAPASGDNDPKGTPSYAASRKLGADMADAYFAALTQAATVPSMATYVGPTTAPDVVKKAFEQAFADLTGPEYDKNHPLEERLGLAPPPKQPDPGSAPDPEAQFKSEMRAGQSTKYAIIAGSTAPIAFRFYEIDGQESQLVFAEVPNLPGSSAPFDPNTYDLLTPEQLQSLANIVTYRSPGSTVAEILQEYYDEWDTWKAIKQAWAQAQADAAAANKQQQQNQGGDPYDSMAQALVGWWLSQGSLAFASAPASFPATIPTPGTYTVIAAGDPSKLAAGIRSAYNAGAILSYSNPKAPNMQDTALTLVATGLAATFAQQLLQVKMLYNGMLPPAIPVVGLVVAVV